MIPVLHAIVKCSNLNVSPRRHREHGENLPFTVVFDEPTIKAADRVLAKTTVDFRASPFFSVTSGASGYQVCLVE